MTNVTKEVDLRAFPMEIAKQMLELGRELNMTLGVSAYLEAEIKLDVWLKVLGDYKEMFFNTDLGKQTNAVKRFIILHTNNGNLKTSLARQLLEFMDFFPTTREYPYQDKMDDTEIHDDCDNEE